MCFNTSSGVWSGHNIIQCVIPKKVPICFCHRKELTNHIITVIALDCNVSALETALLSFRMVKFLHTEVQPECKMASCTGKCE